MKKINIKCDLKITYDLLCEQVNALCKTPKGSNSNVTFSIFNTDTDVVPVGNDWHVLAPNIFDTKPIYKGKCKFLMSYWRVVDEPVYSEEVTDPSLGDAIIICDKMMKERPGYFLEGININSEKVLEFVIGS